MTFIIIFDINQRMYQKKTANTLHLTYFGTQYFFPSLSNTLPPAF